MTCYLCQPGPNPHAPGTDEHDAWEEACADCDARYWTDPVFILEETC
jgi:cytochrome c5